jgi:ubiquitin carboxyl-terminal hydrolase 47
MNPAALAAALAGRRQYVDDNSVSGYGLGTGSASSASSVTKSIKEFPGQYIDRPESGLAGLLNQGATCYLNSLLQSLYMTPEFRQAVYEWRYNDVEDEKKHSIPLQLQRLFARLQCSIRGACESKALTTSFGWVGAEAFVQHDVVELSNVLFEALERSSAHEEKINDFITNKIAGRLMDYLECKVCSTRRERFDRFTCLPMAVRGMKQLENSFRAFENTEELDGVNCDVCGQKQTFLKGMKIVEPPYVLMLQLNRFEFSYELMDKVKLKDELRFPQTLNLMPFIRNESASSQRSEGMEAP